MAAAPVGLAAVGVSHVVLQVTTSTTSSLHLDLRLTRNACAGIEVGPCGPHPTLKTKRNKEIRGLRVCQNEGCGLLQNRDKTGARNIGLQFERLLAGKGAIRDMTDEEIEFHRLNLCLECDS